MCGIYLPVQNPPETLHTYLHKILLKLLGVQNLMEQNLKTIRVNYKTREKSYDIFLSPQNLLSFLYFIKVFYFKTFILIQ